MTNNEDNDWLAWALGAAGGTAIAYFLTRTSCNNCGVQNPKSNKRCKSCGAYLE